jgi:hypothetical protein
MMRSEAMNQAILAAAGKLRPATDDELSRARLEQARDMAVADGDDQVVSMIDGKLAALAQEAEEQPRRPDFSSGARRPLPREVPANVKMNQLIFERWRGPLTLGRRR